MQTLSLETSHDMSTEGEILWKNYFSSVLLVAVYSIVLYLSQEMGIVMN